MTRGVRLMVSALGALWFFVIPALFTAVVIQWLVPAPDVLGSDFARQLRTLAVTYPFYCPLVLFLGFSAILRYWRLYLPGGRFLSPLPAKIAARAPRSKVDALTASAKLSVWLERPGNAERVSGALSVAARPEFEASRQQLASALERLDARAAELARLRLQTWVARQLNRAQRLESLRFLGWLVAAALLALLLRASTFQVYRLLSGSMTPSLAPGEYVLASRLPYAPPWRRVLRVPARGDIVVFQRDADLAAGDWVKRVIGLPGDRVEMVRGGHPVINGWEVPSCDAGMYYEHSAQGPLRARLLVEFLGERAYLTVHTPFAKSADPYVVKDDELFVLGDNRNQSLDSRFWAPGDKPSGLKLSELRGEVVRSLALNLPDSTPHYTFLAGKQPLDLFMPLFDTRDLQSGIQACLSSRPTQTQPPPPARP